MARMRKNQDGSLTPSDFPYGPTEYEMIVHDYAGTNPDSRPDGFYEIIEIKDPPEEQPSFFAHFCFADIGSIFYGFDSLAKAVAGRQEFFREAYGRKLNDPSYVPTLAGCLTAERNGLERPWFYETA